VRGNWILQQHRGRAGARFIEVELRRVRLKRGARTVLRDINWRIRPGQRWVLLGPNGAGKTQLLKLLAGDVWPAPGRSLRRYRYRGECFDEPYDIKNEIAYLGAERQDRYEHYEWDFRVERVVATGLARTDIPLAVLRAMHRREVRRLLARLRIESLAGRRFLSLSYGERRLVLLARALAWRPKLLLLDELFSGLDASNHARVAQGLRRLSRTALPWVLTTHRLEDLPASATHLCQLENGRIVVQGRMPGLLRRAAVRRQSPRDARGRNRIDRAPNAAASAMKPRAAVLIALRRASAWRGGVPVLRNISLDVRRGDNWIVHGANGSGKSTLIQVLYGDIGVARGGRIERDGIGAGVPLQVFKRRVGFIAPELQAIYPRGASAEELVASGLHASIGLDDVLRTRARRRVRQALQRVGAARLSGSALRTLSYGQIRRLLFARALINEPDILLLDEPYAGLDMRTRTALRTLVEHASVAGLTTVMATHHRDEWACGATHELELVRGRAVYCGPLRA